MAVGAVAFVNGWLTGPRRGRIGRRLYWWMWAALFAFLSIDEYYTVHEAIAGNIRTRGQIAVYTAGGVVLVGVILALWRTGIKEEMGSVPLLLAGLAFMGFGGLLLDFLASFYLCRPISGDLMEGLSNFFGNPALADVDLCNSPVVVEEFLEMAGVTVVLAGFVAYAQQRLGEGGWRRMTRALGMGSALYTLWFVANIWLLPTIEARLLTEPVQAEYMDGALSLVGYRVSRDVVQPGGNTAVRLYWRANDRLPKRYYLSAHLVTHPDVDSVTQNDIRIGGWTGWQTNTWFPGVVMRDVVRLDLPEDAPTPKSYWLILRVFEWEGHEYRIDDLSKTVDVPISQTGQPLFEENVLILSSIPAVSDSPIAESPTEADYQFDDGFKLTGYSLPAAGELGETLPIGFWWQTQTDVEGEMTQFIHMIHVNGVDYAGFDQPTFGGSFPTSDWPARMQVVDEVGFPLPEDLPPGEYRVYTGMYAAQTGERRPVSGSDGQPVQDFSIFLGTVLLEP
jgi:hypothetical protein